MTPSSLPGGRKSCGYVIKLSLLNTWFGGTLEQPMEFLESLLVLFSKKAMTPEIGLGKHVASSKERSPCSIECSL